MGREVKNAREVAESSKRRARMKAAKAKGKIRKRPDWLPEGWIMRVRVGSSGQKLKNYTSPGSEQTFHSKQEVLRYLEVSNSGSSVSTTSLAECNKSGSSVSTSSLSECNKSTGKAEAINPPEWLPSGWTLEIRTRLSGDRAGEKYKCYFDPFSGSRFYSKAKALHFVKSINHNASTSGEERCLKASTTDNVPARIEHSPDGLPSGWIKETIFSKSNNASRIRRELYYTDPVNGYIFRSLKEAVRYVKTGEVSKHALEPRKKSLNESCSLGKESAPPISVEELKSLGDATRQRIVAKEASASNGERLMEIEGLPDKLCLPPEEHALSESIQKPDATSSGDMEGQEGKSDKKRSRGLEAAIDGSLNTSKHGEPEAKGVRPSKKSFQSKKENKGSEVLLEPTAVIEKSPEMTNEVTPVPQERKQQKSKTTSLTLPRRSSKRLAGLEPPETADEKRRGFEAAVDCSLKTSKHGEEKPQRIGPTNKISLSEKENKGSEVLLEPTAVIEKSSQVTNEVTPVPQERKQEPTAVIEKSSQVTNEVTPVPQERKQQKRKAKSLMLPRRSSKRLAGLEPRPTTDLVLCRPSCQPTSNSVYNEIEESVPMSEPEKMETVESTHQPLSNGIEESITLSEPEKMNIMKSAYRPLSNGIAESVPLSQSEKMYAVEATHQPLSNGIEKLVPSSDPEKMNIVEATNQPIFNGTYNQTEELAPSQESVRVESADETYRPLSNVVLNGTEAAASLPQPERAEAVEKTSRPLSNGLCNGIEKLMPSTDPASLGEQALLGGQTSVDGPLSQFSLPFSAAWSDPCIEFAVKTLMGEIPVLDEGLAIEEYVQKQLNSVGASNSRPSAAIAASDIRELDPAKQFGPTELLKKHHLPIKGEGKPFPFEKGLPPRAEASKVKVRFL